MNVWIASFILYMASTQMTRAQDEQLDHLLVRAMIQEQVDLFMADFTNTKMFPGVQFTNAQLTWFNSIGTERMVEFNLEKLPLKMRKEYRTLTTTERSKLHDAFNAMKTTAVDGMSQYDIFVNMHTYVQAPGAHGGAAFLSWHREYLWRMELVLQSHDPTVMLPYFDTQLDQQLPDPSDSAIWTPEYLGNNDGDVNSGFAKPWITTSMCGSSSLSRYTVTGAVGRFYLFGDNAVNHVLNAADYKDLYNRYNSTFEGDHNEVHVYIGGHMASVTCSPNDPVFWMHHAYIDCLWEEYRQTTSVDPEFDYPPTTDPDWLVGGAVHQATSPMSPFTPLINIHGLSDHYTNFYYRCAKRPTTCYSNSQCGSLLLYCSLPERRCRAKVKMGGNCAGLRNDACDSTQCPRNYFIAKCVNDTCTCEQIHGKDLTI